ncbi:uncharacterized protein LOC116205468 [Punica granatum]|uniref:Uncharacterized protein n=2 Tax=Punica granatum TaxID=22663 RepID=A0A218XT96_PUNGR|nr:uncharacterized protein LOC116205468 [Punica granatum]OWM88257.1 hypothetical protein CDL15_Pgr003669 [Punica granatum]PKI45363.1 hypothetical protein CRG98_034167 [Punica granatum]
MVLWEIALGTAYFLGLKRTYRLALRMQRKLISRKHPKTRLFLQRRTRAVSDATLKAHRYIQEKDIGVRRNLGKWIRPWLHRIKLSARVYGSSAPGSGSNSSLSTSITEQIRKSTASQKSLGRTFKYGEAYRRMLSSSWTMRSKPFQPIAMMMGQACPALGNPTQQRHLTSSRLELPGQTHIGGKWDGVIRKDIMQWVLQK